MSAGLIKTESGSRTRRGGSVESNRKSKVIEPVPFKHLLMINHLDGAVASLPRSYISVLNLEEMEP